MSISNLKKNINKLNDEDWRVRKEAAEELGKIGNANAVIPLIKMLTNDEEEIQVKWTVASTLGKLGDKKAIEPLIEIFREYILLDTSGKENLIEEVVLALGRLGGNKAVETLIYALRFESTKSSAAWALGEIGDTKAIKPLVEILHEGFGDHYKKVSSIIALGKIGDPQIVPEFIEILMNKNSHELKEAAAWALGQIGDTRALMPLIAVLKYEFTTRISSRLRKALVIAIGKYKSVVSLPALAFIIATEKELEIKNAALEVMTLIGDIVSEDRDKALLSISKRLEDEDWLSRREAVESLKFLEQDSKVNELLVEELSDENEEIRQIAIEILGNTGDKSVIDPLVRILQDNSDNVRQKAKDAINKIDPTFNYTKKWWQLWK